MNVCPLTKVEKPLSLPTPELCLSDLYGDCGNQIKNGEGGYRNKAPMCRQRLSRFLSLAFVGYCYVWYYRVLFPLLPNPSP